MRYVLTSRAAAACCLASLSPATATAPSQQTSQPSPGPAPTPAPPQASYSASPAAVPDPAVPGRTAAGAGCPHLSHRLRQEEQVAGSVVEMRQEQHWWQALPSSDLAARQCSERSKAAGAVGGGGLHARPSCGTLIGPAAAPGRAAAGGGGRCGLAKAAGAGRAASRTRISSLLECLLSEQPLLQRMRTPPASSGAALQASSVGRAAGGAGAAGRRGPRRAASGGQVAESSRRPAGEATGAAGAPEGKGRAPIGW